MAEDEDGEFDAEAHDDCVNWCPTCGHPANPVDVQTITALRAEIASLRAELAALQASSSHAGDVLSLRTAARQDAEEIERLKEALKSAEKGLKPFANAVFNDNGDMSVSPCHDGYQDFISAYFVQREVRAALACRPQEKDNG